jgi:23S rRNA (pseudouridine1915-N3)-methyltransferase
MRCRLIAAGARLPAWIDQGFADYQKRFVKPFSLELKEIAVAQRHAGEPATRAQNAEGKHMLTLIKPGDFVVALDVKGKLFDTESLAKWLALRLQEGRNFVFAIGGPDGLAPQVLERADFRWSLSPLTFPHALVRIIFAEQLYRAVCLLAGHPYHRG